MNVLIDKLRKFIRKEYRDGYMQTQVRGGIAYQIKALREKFGMSQSKFASVTGKKQSVVSRLEDVEYGKVSVQTLLDIASSLDVALLVRFVSYPEFLSRYSDMSVKALQPDTISESLNRESQSIALWPESSYEGVLARISSPRISANSSIQRPEKVLRQNKPAPGYWEQNLTFNSEEKALNLGGGLH